LTPHLPRKACQTEDPSGIPAGTRSSEGRAPARSHRLQPPPVLARPAPDHRTWRWQVTSGESAPARSPSARKSAHRIKNARSATPRLERSERSREHEALASARVTAQCLGMGYAAGAAAGLMIKERLSSQQVNGERVAESVGERIGGETAHERGDRTTPFLQGMLPAAHLEKGEVGILEIGDARRTEPVEGIDAGVGADKFSPRQKVAYKCEQY